MRRVVPIQPVPPKKEEVPTPPKKELPTPPIEEKKVVEEPEEVEEEVPTKKEALAELMGALKGSEAKTPDELAEETKAIDKYLKATE